MHAAGDGFSISGSDIEPVAVIDVDVFVDGPDAEAKQILAPLIDTLGYQDPEGIRFCGADKLCGESPCATE